MGFSSKIFFNCLLLLAIATTAMATIDCYVCAGDACKDPFKKDASGVTTQSNCSSCLKGKAKAAGQEVVTRSCGLAAGKDGCVKNSVHGASGEVCTCSTNLCNGAQTNAATALMVLLPILAAKYLF